MPVILAIVCSTGAVAEPRFLRSADNLEDSRGYCLDIPGFGPRLRKDAPISTHSCKYSLPGFWVDELFELTDSLQLRLPEYDLCLSAEALEAGSHINTVACEDSAAHAWVVNADGRVTPEGAPALCVTLAAQKVYVNSALGNITPYSSRSVSLEDCSSNRQYYQRWRWADSDEIVTRTANTMRSGMSAEVARKIRELGNEIRPPETAALYADQPRMFNSADVTVSDAVSYGPHDQQQLQVYSGNNRNHPQRAAPIIVLVHGGSFSAGDLGSLAHAATHFAGLGFVVVNMTYPMAPEATWPSGGESVALAVMWVKENAADLNGSADRIFLLGHSAGGAHVADFIFRPSVVDAAGAEVAGAILASPVVNLDTDDPDPFTAPYYGDNSDQWGQKQAAGNVERTSIPVLTLVAEYDPDGFHKGVAMLNSELVVENGVRMRLRQMPGHNHISYIAAIGTRDTLTTEEVIDFVTTAGR